ncbi:MAG: hypothetical protein GX270_05115 [Clostridiaceae bacterium]|nr:hypothetical protein [Clostridiaceae bacterium]
MKIYNVGADADEYNFFELVNEEDWDLKSFDGTKLAELWKAFNIKCARSKKYPLGDIAYITPVHPLINSGVVEIFKDIFNNKVELLPVLYSEPYYFINVINIIDALDMEKSEFKRYSSGKIMYCTKYVFKENIVGNNSIFKTPQFPTAEILVTEEFVKRVEENDLKGFVFEELWDSEK